MNKLLTVVFLLVFPFSVSALDFKTYGELQARPGKVSAAVINSHLDAIATSFVTYERMLFKAHGKRLLCMPNNIQITPSSLEMAIHFAEGQFKSRDLSNYPVSELAFMGLVSRFPCPSLSRPAK